jgi:hypothetical protein
VTSDANGELLLGPFPVERRWEASLYHPDFAVVSIVTNAAVLKLDSSGVADFGTVTLSPGHWISGSVRDSAGAPVSNAWVAAQPSANPDPFRPRERPVTGGIRFAGLRVGRVRATRTDGAGGYLLKGLESFEYSVAAWAADYPPAHTNAELWRAEAGELRQEKRDFVLRPEPESVTELSVRLQEGDMADRPFTGATVRVTGDGDSIGMPGYGGLTWFRGRTGMDGKLTIRSLPNTNTRERWDGLCHFWVEDGRGNEWCSGQIRPGGRQDARFAYADLNVRVEGGGRPLDGLYCRLECVENGRSDPSSEARGIHPRKQWTATWFEGGSLSCTGLVCGTWRMTLWAPGYEKLILERDLSAKGIEETVRLAPGRARLVGKVRDSVTREPIDHAKILVTAVNPPEFGWFADWTPARCLRSTTADDGRFALEGMPAENQMVQVRMESPRYMPLTFEMRTRESVYTEERELQPAGWLAANCTRAGAAVTGEVALVWADETAHPKGRFRGPVIAQAGGAWTSGPMLPGAYFLETGVTNVPVRVRAGETNDVGTVEVGPEER